jgi:hypothetical protein
MMPLKKFILSLGFVLPFRLAISQVVISEIMYDPSGSENSDEFVELANVSSRDTIDLRGWRLGDGTGDDALKDTGNGLRLNPNQYAVILDPDYFGQSMSYNSLIPDEALILTVEGNTLGSGGLSNSKSETITVLDSEGRVVDQHAYLTGNKPGYSEERINLTASESPENWAESRVPNGTPGCRNSVAKVPSNLNLANLSFHHSSGGFIFTAVVFNEGTMTVTGFTLHFYEDVDQDSMIDEKETIGTIAYERSLSPGDSTVLSIERDFLPGIHLIAVRLFMDNDEKPENNIRYSRIIIEYPENALVINEIMYNPASGSGEWIELMNIQPNDVELAGWRISDRDSLKKISFCLTSCIIPAGGYIVITGDSSLLERHPELSAAIQVAHHFPNLNNDSDSVTLYDPSGNRIDCVEYFDIRGAGKGISIERINPYQSSGDADNWHISISRNGATPGESNSVNAVSRLPEGSVDVHPNPFSPDGDGWEDAACISFILGFEAAYLRLAIYDVRGRIIRNFKKGEPTGKTGCYFWDGRDDLERPVSIGQYVVFLEASEQEGVGIFCFRSVLVLARKL